MKAWPLLAHKTRQPHVLIVVVCRNDNNLGSFELADDLRSLCTETSRAITSLRRLWSSTVRKLQHAARVETAQRESLTVATGNLFRQG